VSLDAIAAELRDIHTTMEATFGQRPTTTGTPGGKTR